MAKPTTGADAGKTLLLATLNFDPYTGVCATPEDLDGWPDEGQVDYLVILDVTNLSSANPGATIPQQAIGLGNSRWGTPTSVVVHPDQDAAYIITQNQGVFFSGYLIPPQEQQPWLYVYDVLGSGGGFAQAFPIIDPVLLSDFNPSPGHCAIVKNTNLAGATHDRLYIPSHMDGSNQSHVLIMNVTGQAKFSPTVHNIVSHTDMTNHIVLDLVAVPVTEDFLGTGSLPRNVLLGILLDPVALDGKLLALEDR